MIDAEGATSATHESPSPPEPRGAKPVRRFKKIHVTFDPRTMRIVDRLAEQDSVPRSVLIRSLIHREHVRRRKAAARG